MKRALLCAVLLACGRDAARIDGPAPGSPGDLALVLSDLTRAPDAERREAVNRWILTHAEWDAIVVEPYRALYDDYARDFPAAAPPLADQLALGGAATARRHWGGDAHLTLAEARDRWAVPTQFPSAVADVGAAPLDAVFVYVPAPAPHWRALVGLDEAVLARVTALDPACAALVARAGAPSRCSDASWVVVDAALRTDRERFAHACALAAQLCGNPSP